MRKHILVILWVALFLGSEILAQQIALDEDHCEFQGAIQPEDYLGRSGLRFGTGEAICRDVAFLDGTIEFDLAVSGYRAFAYILFRMQDVGEYEEIYLRPHKSNLPDAVQYAPVFRGASNWQLYHGLGSTAAAEIPPFSGFQ